MGAGTVAGIHQLTGAGKTKKATNPNTGNYVGLNPTNGPNRTSANRAMKGGFFGLSIPNGKTIMKIVAGGGGILAVMAVLSQLGLSDSEKASVGRQVTNYLNNIATSNQQGRGKMKGGYDSHGGGTFVPRGYMPDLPDSVQVGKTQQTQHTMKGGMLVGFPNAGVNGGINFNPSAIVR